MKAAPGTHRSQIAQGQVDPVRLAHQHSDCAPLLKAYLQRTRPGACEGVAAWYRLRGELDRERAPVGPRWSRAGLVSALATGAFTVLLFLLAPERAALRDPFPRSAGGTPQAPAVGSTDGESTDGNGSGAGANGANAGMGGMHGTSGARGQGGSAAAGELVTLPHAG